MLKKTVLALMSLSSGIALAGSMGPICTPGNVTVPCEARGFEFGAHALYVQPFGNPYTAEHTTNHQMHNNVVGSYIMDRGLVPNWGWGFDIEGAYHFGKGNDVNLNWAHLRESTAVTQITSTVNQAARSSLVNSKENLGWDSVNLEFGKHITLDDAMFLRAHAGLSYLRVMDDFHISGKFNAADATNDEIDTYSSAFSGLGPRAGIALHYSWMNGFVAYGKVAGSLFAGSTKSNYVTDFPTGNYIQSTNYNAHPIVAGLDSKLGLEYTRAVSNGSLKLDVGWLWADYINALMMTADEHINHGFSSTNFGVQGLYFGLKWLS